MTRKEFLKNFILFLGGLLFIKKAGLFKKIFDTSGRNLKEAKFYRKLE
ncbi:MAG: hypothetical protein ABII25_08370 [bacterium]